MATTLLYKVGTEGGVPEVLTVTGRDAASDCCCDAPAACHWYTEWTWFCAMSCDPSPLADLDAPAVIEGSPYATGQWNNMDENSLQKRITGSLPDGWGIHRVYSAVARLLDGTVGTYKRGLPAWVNGGNYNQCDVVQHDGYGYRCVRANSQLDFEATVNGVVFWTRENAWVQTGSGTVCVEEGDTPVYAGFFYLHGCAGPDVLSPRPQGPCGYVYRMYGPPHGDTCSSCPPSSDASTVAPSFDIECPAITCCTRPRFDAAPQNQLRQPCKIIISHDNRQGEIIDVALSLQSVEDLRENIPRAGNAIIYAHITPEDAPLVIDGRDIFAVVVTYTDWGDSGQANVEFVRRGVQINDPTKASWAVDRTYINHLGLDDPLDCGGLYDLLGTYFSPFGSLAGRVRIWFDDPEI